MPVPPPTFPSATGPPRALSIAAHASCLVTWKPLMSFSPPSHVSATTGRDHSSCCMRPWRTTHSITASRTTPTECVLVIITGPHKKPDSSTHVVPVISPLPFIVNQPAKTGSSDLLPRGNTAVTPVRTGPLPTMSFPLPTMSVRWPTSTPVTSVMASRGPGVPSKGTPRSRARSGCWAAAPRAATSTARRIADVMNRRAWRSGRIRVGWRGGKHGVKRRSAVRCHARVNSRLGAVSELTSPAALSPASHARFMPLYDDRFPLPHHPIRLLAGEPGAALQPAVRAATPALLSDPRRAAGARPALGTKRRGRDSAGVVHRRGRRLGAAAVHAVPDRRRAVARRPRHAVPRIAAPGRRVRHDARGVGRSRPRVRPVRGQRYVGRPGPAPDALARSRKRQPTRCLDAPDGVARRRDLRGAAVSRAARRGARGGSAGAARLAPDDGRRRRHRAGRGDLLGFPLHRPLRRPAAGLFVRVPHGGGAVLLGAVSRAGIRHHRVDARAVRRITPALTLDGDQTGRRTENATTRRTDARGRTAYRVRKAYLTPTVCSPLYVCCVCASSRLCVYASSL